MLKCLIKDYNNSFGNKDNINTNLDNILIRFNKLENDNNYKGMII